MSRRLNPPETGECGFYGVPRACPDCGYATLDRLAYWTHRHDVHGLDRSSAADLFAHHEPAAETRGRSGEATGLAAPLPVVSVCAPGAALPVASGLPFDNPQEATCH